MGQYQGTNLMGHCEAYWYRGDLLKYVRTWASFLEYSGAHFDKTKLFGFKLRK